MKIIEQINQFLNEDIASVYVANLKSGDTIKVQDSDGKFYPQIVVKVTGTYSVDTNHGKAKLSLIDVWMTYPGNYIWKSVAG
jgi:hypothetical protein